MAKSNGSKTGASGTATAAVATSTVVPARGTRRTLMIRNEHATDSARIGFGGTNNYLLKAGEQLPLNTIAAVTAQRVGANDIPLTFIETFD